MSICIFCRLPFSRDRRRSDEHVWPRWMHGQLPEKPGAQRLFDAAELVADHPYGRVLHKHFKPRVVCRPCNTGWMSRLETATKPILRPLMLGEATHLDRESQTILSAWASLKAMVAEFSDPATRATEVADLERMHRKQLPPTRATLWIGEHEGTLWTTRYIHRGMRISHGPVQPGDDPPLNGQATTFAVGRVIFHLLTLPDGFLYDGAPIPNGRIATRIRQIYPNPSPFDWPIGRTLTDGDAYDLGDMMTQAYKRLVEGPVSRVDPRSDLPQAQIQTPSAGGL
jgi:hypothetical protein